MQLVTILVSGFIFIDIVIYLAVAIAERVILKMTEIKLSWF